MKTKPEKSNPGPIYWQETEIWPHCDGSGEGKWLPTCPACGGSGEEKKAEVE